MKIFIEEKYVLLSDFDLWHYVLNEWDIPVVGEDGRNWGKVFDLDWYQEDITRGIAEKQIQATFWELQLSSVLSARKFVGR